MVLDPPLLPGRMRHASTVWRSGDPSELNALAKRKVDFNVDDEMSSIKAFVERLGGIVGSPVPKSKIDLTQCQYLGPDATALLAAIVHHYRFADQSLNVVPPKAPLELRAYLHFSGLAKLIGHASEPNAMFVPPNPPTVQPLQQFKMARFQDADAVISLSKAHGALTEDSEEYLRVFVNEIIQNTQDHADSPVGALLSARYMKDANEVRVAIVDRGVGICTSLRTRIREVESEDALRKVLEGGYSAKSRENNEGLGISNLASFIRTVGGSLCILSESAIVELRGGHEPKIQIMERYFHGTGVFFTLPVRLNA